MLEGPYDGAAKLGGDIILAFFNPFANLGIGAFAKSAMFVLRWLKPVRMI